MRGIVDISVLVTCYNKEKYLDDCISSVLRQTKQPKEIIVVHDACENPSHHAKTTSIFLKDNFGVAGARRSAFRYSTGKLVLFLDADDVLSPDYLEKMVLTIASGADIAYPDLFLWCGDDSRLTITPEKLNKAFVKKFERVVIPVTSLMKRSVYSSLDGFRKMEVLEDLDFFVRAIKHGFVFKKSHTLLWYRRYGGTRNSIGIEKRKKVLKEIIEQI